MPWISSTELWRLKRGNIEYKLVNDAMASVQQSLLNINQRLTKMANSIDDLNAAVANISTAVADYTAAVSAEIAAIQAANQSGSNDAAIEAAVTNLKSLTATLKSDTAAAQPPTPVPTT
jgi:predicted  nucleic acid-binding Zn-ribbon protein